MATIAKIEIVLSSSRADSMTDAEVAAVSDALDDLDLGARLRGLVETLVHSREVLKDLVVTVKE